ncbi:hypothetical protein RHGRI_003815 [Rhododendron griersonianum]|uniref:Uncharacterized protein n=1 Tax=Rhododendron griersonianum TaxID=479676 RepID=A0AAV6L6S5_9ERIC|nr:hypothetical protein RHGRI_003815 [Rhododendron griersonianum]
MAPKIAQPYLKIPIGNSISGGIAPNRFVRNGSRFLKWGELVLAANGSISRVPIVSSWRRIKAIFGTIALVEAKNQSYINSISSFLSRFRIYRPFRHSTNFQRIKIGIGIVQLAEKYCFQHNPGTSPAPPHAPLTLL